MYSARTRVSREGAVRVGEVQRARVLAAMAHVVAERGVSGVTVTRVVARAGVSRRTFYEQFAGCEECFLAVFEDAVARATRVASDAAAGVPLVWREQVRAGLAALLAFLDDEPALGRLLVVDALGAGPMVLERRAQTMRGLAAILEGGRHSQTKRGARKTTTSPPPELTAEGLVGAVFSVIHARMLQTGASTTTANRSKRPGGSHHAAAPTTTTTTTTTIMPLTGLLNPLMAMIVLPYKGQAAARRELARPVPKRPRSRSRHTITTRESSTDPLQGLNMRLTYRTLIVLSTIATHPGASNRHIADHAGIHDQGQISKLLTRLQHLGLIHNTGHGQTHGEPNAWTLTPHGTHIQHTLTTTP